MIRAWVFLLLTTLPGCGWAWKNRQLTELQTQVEQLQGRLSAVENSREGLLQSMGQLHDQLALLQEAQVRQEEIHADELKRLQEEKSQESEGLLRAQQELSESLKKELGDARAKLAMTDRGLVITFLDEVFFDSGKAVIKEGGMETLDKVAQVLQATVPQSQIAVEGHTDDEPIHYSGWRSNWELSSGRALAVVHHLIDKQGLQPERIRAIGFGEFHPVASNDVSEGRRQNRRVEVVILPADLRKVRE